MTMTGETRCRARLRPRCVSGRWCTLIVVLGLGLATTGCGEREPTAGDARLRTNEFIEIIVALRNAELELDRTMPADSIEAEFARRKAAILEQYSATDDDVRAFVERHHARPGFMAEVWDTIAQRLRAEPPAPVGVEPSAPLDVESPTPLRGEPRAPLTDTAAAGEIE